MNDDLQTDDQTQLTSDAALVGEDLDARESALNARVAAADNHMRAARLWLTESLLHPGGNSSSLPLLQWQAALWQAT